MRAHRPGRGRRSSAIGLAGLAFSNAKQKADDLMALAESYADSISDMYEYGMEKEDEPAEVQGFSSWLEDDYDALHEPAGPGRRGDRLGRVRRRRL